jgi:ribonuclease E
MSKKMLIDATHTEETRVVVVDGNKVEEFDFETVNKRQLAGNIYLAKVTRVEPSLQAAFVEYGGNRHGFLAFAEIHPDYYQIPVADRQALLEEERAYARAEEEDENRPRRRKPVKAVRAANAPSADPVRVSGISGMDVVDLGDDSDDDTLLHDGLSPARRPTWQETADQDTADQDTADQDGTAFDAGADEGDDGAHEGAEIDDEIESVAEEDVTEEISQPRKPRPRRYKIQEVIKVRQIMLVQVVKEERGNKGAALTTYLSLAGRYCVLMPNTARGGGISRKITQAADRKKLKEIAAEMEVPDGAGLIIRTAGAKRTKPEIKRDYEYLMRLWEQVRELTLKSIAPAKIYEEGDLIKRTIRDLYSREIEEVLVEGEAGFRTARDFMRMIMPSHARQVQRYTESMPLFARYQVESYLSGMFNPVVQLKSGGYIVIGVTEALVAIDVNSGRATKEGSIEETAVKTNLEAAEEIARQLRLRDLAGLIVIDFIDMDERKNNAAVEKRLKDKLKTDRARIQVGRISGFGLMEMSRQRLRPGMLESTTQPCSHCHGTGLIRSDDSLGLQILRALEEEGTRKRSKEVLLKAPIGIVNFLINQKREHIALIEARYGMSVRIEADPQMITPDFLIEKFKTAIRVVPEPSAVISVNPALMGAPVDEIEDDLLDEVQIEDEDDLAATEAAAATGAAAEAGAGAESAAEPAAEPVAVGTATDATQGNGKKKRRRRRRRKGGNGADAAQSGEESADVSAEDAGDDSVDEAGEDDAGEDEAGIDVVIPSEVHRHEDQPHATPVEAPVEVAVVEVSLAAPAVTPPSSTDAVAEVVTEAAAAIEVAPAVKPIRTRKPATNSTRTRRTKVAGTTEVPEVAVSAEPSAEPSASEPPVSEPSVSEAAAFAAQAAEVAAPKKSRTRRKPAAKAAADAAIAPAADLAVDVAVDVAAPARAKPATRAAGSRKRAAKELVSDVSVQPAVVAPSAPGADIAPQPEAGEDPNKPKRRGWWSVGR